VPAWTTEPLEQQINVEQLDGYRRVTIEPSGVRVVVVDLELSPGHQRRHQRTATAPAT
jgi:hypothetical protein